MSPHELDNTDTWTIPEDRREFTLHSGSAVAVLGGGPAGSFFSIFLLEMAQRIEMHLEVEIYERRDFSFIGPAGCNMCGGIISESLVQTLAAEGIELPPTVVERGIDSYFLHTDEASVRIDTPVPEKRIASVHRGGGPMGTIARRWQSFDQYLLDLAIGKGAHLIRGKVDTVRLSDGRPILSIASKESRAYDLLVVAAGINTPVLDTIRRLGLGYRPPKSISTYIAEFRMDEKSVQASLGNSMHVFLLSMPHLEFASIIPKGEFATVCLLGHGINDNFFREFLRHPQVRSCFPSDWEPSTIGCHCSPRMQVRGAKRPYADRIVCIGDASTSRLFKDGIGSAYRTAKAAAATAVFHGVSASHFRRYFVPLCRGIKLDNFFGRIVFMFTREIQRRRFHRRGVLTMTAAEQWRSGPKPRMSGVLWDTFTGSASYGYVLRRTLHPIFIARLLGHIMTGAVRTTWPGTTPRILPTPAAH